MARRARYGNLALIRTLGNHVDLRGSDRRLADHDTINQVANVSLRSSAVRGQPTEGLGHESFDIGGWNAKDRSRFALVALQSRLRYIIAPALGPLPRSSRAHPVAAVVIELASEQRIGRLAGSVGPRGAPMIAEASLDLLPQLLGHDRRVLAFVHLGLMGDPADIDRVPCQTVSCDIFLAVPTGSGHPAAGMRYRRPVACRSSTVHGAPTPPIIQPRIAHRSLSTTASSSGSSASTIA